MSAVRDALHKAARGENLSEQEAGGAMGEILRGESSAALISGLLVALRMKGETVDEVVGFARAMRAAAAKVESPAIDPSRLVDT
jgi:anthranilate phosphoribosyltransferase